MKIYIVVIVPFLLFSCKQKCQDCFQGEVRYSYSYSSESLNEDSLAAVKVKRSIFRFDNENYQSAFVDANVTTYHYLSEINRCLSAVNSELADGCDNYGIATDTILSWEIKPTDEKILGFECELLEFKTRQMLNQYYVSKSHKIAPATYKNHVAYNWKFYGEKTNGALILKAVHQFKEYTMTGVATHIREFGDNVKALEIEPSVIKEICAKQPQP